MTETPQDKSRFVMYPSPPSLYGFLKLSKSHSNVRTPYVSVTAQSNRSPAFTVRPMFSLAAQTINSIAVAIQVVAYRLPIVVIIIILLIVHDILQDYLEATPTLKETSLHECWDVGEKKR
jgi:hypothetical protein